MMKALEFFSRKMVLLVLLLVTIGTVGSGGLTQTAATAASAKAYVYYVSDQVLYRVATDGSETQKITENFAGNGLTSTGKYLYFYYEDAMGIQRLSLSDPEALITDYIVGRNILYYLVDGPFLYFLDDTGSIYRTLADAEDKLQLTLIADNADVNFKSFDIMGGRVYYNALRDNGKNWVASKPSDGNGVIQWIASGAIPKSSFYHLNNTSLNLMIDTEPDETEYSLNSMVLYTLPLNCGVPKAANANNPLPSNEVSSGTWSKNYFLFNKGIKLDAKGEDFNFNTGKGFLMDKNGKTLQLSQNAVVSVQEIASNRLVYADSKGKAYISTFANGKVTSSKPLPLTNVQDVRTVKNGTTLTTVLFTKSDAYVLNANSTLTKMAGVESDYSVITDDILGLYYINGRDNNFLYGYSNDGTIKTKLSTRPVSYMALISNN
ncbi:DUF5050 domain-containing protein [Paenibacillus tritici]|uniref:DUF5050 domain-containing protein n=1 Tax=Paenibacillus tritici TaxID=1873425 RepID=A0ABX2DI45_9BACL|nr:DUF5050 domain-containing protein [Paenibacillus tritici]NQX43997.1 DUF5050 domain-containing protein [Paenibacillus tritici]